MEGVPAQGNTIKKGSKMSKLDVVEIWKELHRMPEPGMKEFKTGDFLADALEKLGRSPEAWEKPVSWVLSAAKNPGPL